MSIRRRGGRGSRTSTTTNGRDARNMPLVETVEEAVA